MIFRIPPIDGYRRNRSDVLQSILYYIATTGYSYRQEIVRLMNYRSSKEDSLIENLEILSDDLGLIIQKSVRYFETFGVANIFNLTDEGKAYCSRYYPVVETDYDRLLRMHQLNSEFKHGAAILSFAYFARILGYSVLVVPDPISLPGENVYIPDLFIKKDKEELYVELEMADEPSKIEPKTEDRKRKF